MIGRPEDLLQEILSSIKALLLRCRSFKHSVKERRGWDSYFKELEKLERKIILYESVKTGWLIKIQTPRKDNSEWVSLRDMKGESERLFKKALLAYAWLISREVESGKIQKEGESEISSEVSIKKKEFEESLSLFHREVFKGEPHKWFLEKKISAEIFYNSLNPFRLAWILYFVFLCLFSTLFFLPGKKYIKWTVPVLILGFSAHTFGMVLRSYIMSRPPVSNMYETVLWVPWVGLIAGLVFYWRKSIAPFIASVITAFFCLFLTDSASGILDGSLQPLEAVLRSNFWLSTHVLIITMSYAFFFVAFVLGDMILISFIVKGKKPWDLFRIPVFLFIV